MARFSVVVCHRRFGKTVMAVNKLVKDLINAKQKGLARARAVYVAPLFRQAKQIAWDYAKFYCEKLPGYKANESELRIDFLDDCRLFLIGADNPDSIRGIYADSVVLDEYAQMNPKMWSEVLRPALTDRKGSAMFIGTPKGKNVFHDLYKHGLDPDNVDWTSHLFKASETGYVDEGELLAAKSDMTDEEYAQEYECSWEAAIKGAYYGKLMEIVANEKRIRSVPWESTLEVHTAWDLGIDDSTAIWFYQTADREIRLINFYESSGVGLDHYVKYLKQQHYVYGNHFLPHDVKVKELSTGRSRLEMLRGLGINARVVQKIPVDDGINAARSLLPRCYFDAKKCEKGIEAMRQYKTDWDDKTQTFRQRPKHDWTSHAADAFRYLAVSFRDTGSGRRPTRTISEYDVFDPYEKGPRQTIAEGTNW